MNSKLLIAVLTKDEEANISACLGSALPLKCPMLVVDSGSTDKTVEIAESMGAETAFHPFESFARSRNWILDNYGAGYDWILFLDADERISDELAVELESLGPPGPEGPFGYYIPRRFYFLGKHLRYGRSKGYKVLRLVNPPRSRVAEHTRSFEYTRVDGPVGVLSGAMIHEDRKPLSDWIIKHDFYSTREAEDELAGMGRRIPAASENRKAALLNSLMVRVVPPLARPFLIFVYSYFFKLGFLDGREGFIYAFLHEFWYPLLTAAKIYEMRSEHSTASAAAVEKQFD